MTAGSSGEDQKSKLEMQMSNPAGRYGHDSDMAACILFLAGPGGLFMNGQVLYPDGGKLCSHMVMCSNMRLTTAREYIGAACCDMRVSIEQSCRDMRLLQASCKIRETT